ncbi:hypothetical protein M9Y10_002624 [Tritrichomonas musculus]|uniref:Beige/BEACH domain containing protein n=1 Tax=Tritrichomonas musculus TaxID=1915356 RepID=A0ABR2LBC0_9EUKA
MNLSLIEHHGGDLTQLIWVKYFTMPCKLQKNAKVEQTALENFISSFNYVPATPRSVKKKIEKAKNVVELEESLADLFNFKNIPMMNVLFFCQLILEQKSMVQHSPYLLYIPHYVMRGFIAISYNLQSTLHQYIIGEKIENFQPDLWKFIHLPLLYLLHDNGEFFDDTIKIIDKFLNAFTCIDTIFKLPANDPLRTAYFSFLNLILSSFSIELTRGSSKCMDFLICSYLTTSDKITQITESHEIMKSSTVLFQNSLQFHDNINESNFKSLISIFTNIFSQIPEFVKSPDNDTYTFISSGLSLLTKNTQYIDDKSAKQLTQCLMNFLSWLIDQIPFNGLYEIEQKSQKKELKKDDQIPLKKDENEDETMALEHWSFYFSSESLLPPSPTLKVKNPQISKILFSFQKLMMAAEHVCMTILETFRCCVDVLEGPKKTELSIFFFTSIYGSKLPLNCISQGFILLSMFPDAFPASSEATISDLNWQYHELFLQCLFNFSCQKTENLIFVLNTIQILIHDIEFNKIIDFLQFFRSLLQVDSQINFIHHFLESNIIESCHCAIFKLATDGSLLRQIAALLQTIALTRPVEAFCCSSFLQLMHSFLLIDNEATTEMIAPCFKIGMSLSHSPPLKQGRFAAQSTLEQVFTILKQTSSYEQDKRMTNISLMMVSYITESIPSFDLSILADLLRQGFFETIAKVPYYIKTTESFLVVIELFKMFNMKFPQAVLTMLTKTQTLSIIKEVENSAKQVKMSKEIIDTLFGILFNDQVFIPQTKKLIQNSLIIPMLLHITEDTEFEEYLMETILQICKASVDNTYEFFSADLVGFVLQRIIKEKYIDININIFKWVCLHFFSPLTLNQFFKAMRLPSDGKKHQYHQLLMNTFLDLIISDKKPPVSNYFHFHQKTDGISLRHIDSDLFSFPFSFVTTFKIELPLHNDHLPIPNSDLSAKSVPIAGSGQTLLSPMIPILTIKEKDLIYFSLFVRNASLVLVHMGHVIKELSVPIVKNQWYKLSIVFMQSSIQVSVQDHEYEPIQVSKHDFQHHLMIFFGCSASIIETPNSTSGTFSIDKKNDVKMKTSNTASQSKLPVVILPLRQLDSTSTFHEFFGPTIFMKHESMQKLEMNYEKLNTTRKHPKRAIITFVPWFVKKGVINDVIEQGDSHPFFGYAISSYSTITSIVQFDGIFQCFFPLFVLVNHPFDKKTDIVNDESFLYSILISFQRILSLSENVQSYFEKLGGFQLLVGFFGQIKAEFFTKVVIADLALIYKILMIDSLKHQMIEYIWLNFDLWKAMDGDFQINFYQEYLPMIVDNQTLRATQINSFDFILYMIQDPFPEKVRYNPHLFFFPTNNNKRRRIESTSQNDKLMNTSSVDEIKQDENQNNLCLATFNSTELIVKDKIDYLNTPCKLTDDEKVTIRKLQWEFFDRCITEIPSASTLVNVAMIMCFHEDTQIRLLAFELMEKFISSKSQLVSVVMDMINGYETFLSLVLDPIIDIEYHSINCMFLLGEKEIAGNYRSKTAVDIDSASMSLILLVNSSNIGEKVFDLSLRFLFDFVDKDEDFDKIEPIKMIKILPFVFYVSKFGRKEKVLQFKKKLKNSLEKHLDSFVRFYENKSWPYWLFLFAICLLENQTDIKEIIEFLSSALFTLILDGKEYCIFEFISLLERLEKYFMMSFDKLIVLIYTSLCYKMEERKILSLNFITIMMKELLFKFKREGIAEKEIYEITSDKMNDFLTFFMNQNINNSEFQFDVIKRTDENISDYVLDFSISILRFLSLLSAYDINNSNSNNANNAGLNIIHHSKSRNNVHFVSTHITLFENISYSSFECFCFVFNFIQSYGKLDYINQAQSILDSSIKDINSSNPITIVRSRTSMNKTQSDFSNLNWISSGLIENPSSGVSNSTNNLSSPSSQFVSSPLLNEQTSENHKNQQNAQSSPSISLISFFKLYSTHYHYKILEDKVMTPDLMKHHHDEFIILCANNISEIRTSLLSMIMMVSKKSQVQFSESFNEFVKAYAKTRHIVSLHNHKMASSFFREVTGNFGPWSYATEDVKWIKTTKIDACGRNIFMKINRNFDDHRKASALRKTHEQKMMNELGNPNQTEDELFSPYSSNVGNFKRILNQKDFTFIPAPIEQIKAKSAFAATQISLTKRVSGTLYVYNKKIIFDGNNFSDSFGNPCKISIENHKYIEFNHSSITFIFWRKILHLDVGVEIITTNNTSYLFSFNSNKKRTEFLDVVRKTIDKHVTKSSRPFELLRKACNSCVQTMPGSELLAHSKITKMWQNHEMSNFTYLFFLNIISGRSFNDVSQYPIYPWIISDYDSEKIDLEDPKVYRDLSKPMGALNEKTLARLKMFLEECQDPSQFCLYRTHYSAPAFVIGYLIRTEPFSTLHIMLQGGCYDLPERLFHSIPGTWKSILKVDQSDYRELIPEFFCQHTFLTNSNGFDLGVLSFYEEEEDHHEIENNANSTNNLNNENNTSNLNNENNTSNLNNENNTSNLNNENNTSNLNNTENTNSLNNENNTNSLNNENNTNSLNPTDNTSSLNSAGNLNDGGGFIVDFVDGDGVHHLKKRKRKNIDDVELPKWAKTPYEFIEIHRRALESEQVSKNLHSWIDLIFGVNQRSIEHDNLFHPYTYSDSISSLSLSNNDDSSSNDNLLDPDDETYAVIQSYAANFGVCPTCLFSSPHVKREPIKPFTHTQFFLPVFEDPLVMCKNGNFLTSRTTIYRLKSNTIYSTPTPINENIIDFNKEHLFVLSRGGTTISCVSFKTGEEVGTLSHNNSVINCLCCVGNRAILTGGADCAICVWVPHSLKLTGSIPLHSLPISCVYGDSKFDFVVAIDMSHNVFFHTLKSLRFIHSFKLKNCPSDSKHLIKMTRNGLIVILCTSPFGESYSSIQIFDLYGKKVHQIDMNEHVESIDTTFTSLHQNILVCATADNMIYIYDVIGFNLIKKVNDFIIPRFVCTIGRERTVIAAKMKQNKSFELVQYDF